MRWLPALVLFLSALARADGGVGAATLRLDWSHAVASEAGLSGAIAAGPQGRALLGGPVGVAVGADLELGGGTAGGFLYDDALRAGVGIRVGSDGFAMLLAGAGVSGVTDHLPFGIDLSVEALLEANLGDAVRLLAWARPAWVAIADERGAELNAGLGLRLGNRVERGGWTAGSGYVLGVLFRQVEGATFLGGTLAFHLHFAQ